MRAGPSTEALAGPVAVGARIDVHLGGHVLAVDVPCEDVQIDWASDRVVPGKLTYTCPAGWVPESPGDALNNYGQRSHVVALLDTVEGRDEVDLGWWQHQSWDEQDNGTIKVEALDLLQLLEQFLWLQVRVHYLFQFLIIYKLIISSQSHLKFSLF